MSPDNPSVSSLFAEVVALLRDSRARVVLLLRAHNALCDQAEAAARGDLEALDSATGRARRLAAEFEALDAPLGAADEPLAALAAEIAALREQIAAPEEDVLSESQAVERLPWRKGDARRWLRREGLSVEVDGRRIVVWSEVMDRLRRREDAPSPTRHRRTPNRSCMVVGSLPGLPVE